jgi:peptide/nickel transport system permease protein
VTAAAIPRRRRRSVRLPQTLRIVLGNRPAMVGIVVLCFFVFEAVVGPFIVGPVDRAGAYRPLLDPSTGHIFGTDRSGRDLLRTNVAGSQISLLVGVVSSVITMVIGTLIGIVAGFLGGRWDNWLMRVTDFFYVLPTLVLAVVLAAILGPNLLNVIIVIAVTSWPSTARIIRSQTLSLRERMFVDRSRAYGASSARIMRRQILPNVFGLVMANTTLTVASSIFYETTLSFLGVGPHETYSWGRILEESFDSGALTLGKWAWFVPPGLSVVLVVLAFTLIGGALDEVFDPRLRSREDGAAPEIVPPQLEAALEKLDPRV